ncbi:MAG: ParB/RepB/Spo0J family partition protein, partial [Eubacterium sp.]|nr:ParB/RepB/Spo0J family partition protein [Eubacterium sp.]
MATGRGLNKKRGLESLIPHKIDHVEDPSDQTEKNTGVSSDISIENGVESSKPENKNNNIDHLPKMADEENKSHANSADTENLDNKVLHVRLTEVIPNQEQPRKDFRDETIKELADSIRQYGVIQPLLVQKKGKYYEIIAGERRWRAAKEAGLKEIPVILKKFDEQKTMEISLIENIQRENLNAIEEAEAFQKLIESFQMTQEEVAEKVGKSRSA